MSRKTPLERETGTPLLIVLSGLSGAGKDAALAELKAAGTPFYHVVTVTTRPPRPGERDGIDYSFVTEAAFRQMQAQDELLESAGVYQNWYGVPRTPVRQALAEGRDTVIKVDVQGAATIKKLVPGAVLIFLMPPSADEIVQRLQKRRTEKSDELALRTSTAAEELKQLPLFDYVVYNRTGELAGAVADIKAIIRAEKCRVVPRDVSL